MRDMSRKKRILKLLGELWDIDTNCDMRLGQLLENFVFFNGERGDITSKISLRVIRSNNFE